MDPLYKTSRLTSRRVWHMRRLLALTLLALLGSVVPAPAQDALDQKDDFGKKIDVRLFNRPLELVVETGGRTAACDVLMFSPEGDKLIATGDDKVVRIWPFDPQKGLSLDRTDTLRWASFLQQRG